MVEKILPLGRPLLLFRSSVIKDCLEPSWQPFVLNVVDVGGLDSPFRIRVFDFDSDGGHDMIGEFQTTLRECSLSQYTFALVNPKKKSIPLYKSSGGFTVTQVCSAIVLNFMNLFICRLCHYRTPL